MVKHTQTIPRQIAWRVNIVIRQNSVRALFMKGVRDINTIVKVMFMLQ